MLPWPIHSTVSITDNGNDTITTSVSWQPVWYQPLPVSQKWGLYKADNVTLDGDGHIIETENESFVQDVSVAITSTSQNFNLPAGDDKYYFTKLIGENANGLGEYYSKGAVFNGAP